jgi:hypothetical protein
MSVFAGPSNIFLNKNSDGRYRIESNVITQSGLVFSIDPGISLSYAGSGSNIINLSNTSHIGTVNNNFGYTGSDGTFIFNGTNNFISFPASSLGIEAANKTVCAWIYVTGYNQGVSPIVDRDNSANGYGFWMTTAGKLWYWPGTNRDIIDNGALSVANNVWTYVSFTHTVSTSSLSFYYNGQLSSTRTYSGSEDAADLLTNLNIGAMRNAGFYSFGGNFLKGQIGQVLLYNRPLTQAEIQQNYNSTRNRFGV